MTIRVFLVDDHPMFRAGVRLAIEDIDQLAVVGEAATGEEAVRALRGPEPGVDVVLMDLWLPGLSGVEALQLIRPDPASSDAAPRVLIVSVSAADDAVVAALRAGAHGYLMKGAPRAELVRAVQTVACGGAVFSPAVAARLHAYFSAVYELPSRAAFPQLTDRERQILDLLARGHDNRRIARELVLSEKTVRNHVSHVFAKLEVNDRAAAALRARAVGLGT
jgi:DNA-binding NarL/FixJ family response regulator